jgi:hypothetical protein
MVGATERLGVSAALAERLVVTDSVGVLLPVSERLAVIDCVPVPLTVPERLTLGLPEDVLVPDSEKVADHVRTSVAVLLALEAAEEEPEGE